MEIKEILGDQYDKECDFGIGHYLIPWVPNKEDGDPISKEDVAEQIFFTKKCGPWCRDWEDGVCTFNPALDPHWEPPER